MFLRGPSTKTSLTFLTAIMVLEILNNVGKHFSQKIPVKSSFCREYCGQLEIHLTKIKEILFLRDPSTKTYLIFWTLISDWEIHAHL